MNAPENNDLQGQASFSQRDRLAALRPDVEEVLRRHDVPEYRYKQVMQHLMKAPGTSLGANTALPQALRAELEALGSSVLQLVRRNNAADGSSKLLFECVDGVRIETVVMRYPKRNTVCVSSQAGCPLACSFCATGQSGFRRNLSAAEIVDQGREAAALLAKEGRRLSNVVFMGMGEPLLNLDSVLTAIREFSAADGLGISRRAIAVSTVGIPQGMIRLAKETPQVHLALSLHAPDDRIRSSLMPVAKRYSIRQVLEAADEHFAITRRKLLVEYVLLRGINDTPAQARQLAALLRGKVLTVNLLIWNKTEGPFRPSTPEAQATFLQELTTRGIETTIRASKGETLHGACGQLAGGDGW